MGILRGCYKKMVTIFWVIREGGAYLPIMRLQTAFRAILMFWYEPRMWILLWRRGGKEGGKEGEKEGRREGGRERGREGRGDEGREGVGEKIERDTVAVITGCTNHTGIFQGVVKLSRDRNVSAN